ncbi:MAG: hydroxymethylbilane synthase [Planctomycetota bacterium]
MNPRQLRLATRGSELARTQAQGVAGRLAAEGRAEPELVIVKTTGDRRQDVLLGEAGAIGLFTREVQEALLDRRADFAVHSFKDLPSEPAEGLILAAVSERADPRDLLLIRTESCDPARAPLPVREGARIGTSAARRAAFVRALAPDCEPVLLRGNVPTRLRKLREGRYDAILLAAAGAQRLGLDLDGLVSHAIDLDLWPCSPGQGALALECRADDPDTARLLAGIGDPGTTEAVSAERGLLRRLGGGCGLPLGAFAEYREGLWHLDAAFGPTPDRPAAPLLSRPRVQAQGIPELIEKALDVLGTPAGEHVP